MVLRELTHGGIKDTIEAVGMAIKNECFVRLEITSDDFMEEFVGWEPSILDMETMVVRINTRTLKLVDDVAVTNVLQYILKSMEVDDEFRRANEKWMKNVGIKTSE